MFRLFIENPSKLNRFVWFRQVQAKENKSWQLKTVIGPRENCEKIFIATAVCSKHIL